MTHTVHPYAHRLGIIRDWKSRWFGAGRSFQDSLREDILIRNFLEKRLRGCHVSDIEIERDRKASRVVVKTARPGLIIGRSGEGVNKLRKDLGTLMKKHGQKPENFSLDVEEVKSPEADASIVSEMLVESLERRMPFRRVIKQTLGKVMANRDVLGARILVNGRLGGAEMSRKEEVREGMIPLQTFRADVDFARGRAVLPYGVLGVKVWIYRGEVFEGPDAASGGKEG